FILLVGATHLGSIADGIVDIPGTKYHFSVMSTPNASASQLKTEVVKAKSVVVKEYFIPLNPFKFSSELLEAMDNVLPAEPIVIVECTPAPKYRAERETRSSATKRQQANHQ
ncbi:transcriptional regulator Kaiso, partial [Clarias magur]